MKTLNHADVVDRTLILATVLIGLIAVLFTLDVVRLMGDGELTATLSNLAFGVKIFGGITLVVILYFMIQKWRARHQAGADVESFVAAVFKKAGMMSWALTLVFLTQFDSYFESRMETMSAELVVALVSSVLLITFCLIFVAAYFREQLNLSGSAVK